MTRAPGARGFTLIEVLVAIVVVSIGMLGVASLLLSSMRSADSNYTRQLAVQYAYGIIDRMRANATEAAMVGGPYTATAKAPAATAPSNCVSGSCSAAQLAAYDVWDWQTQLNAHIPGALGAITIASGNAGTANVTVTVQWPDSTAASAFSQTSDGTSHSASQGTNLGSYTVESAL